MLADSRVSVPEMIASPLGMMSFTRGAFTTNPSSTIANWLRGDSRSISRAVMSRNWSVPRPSRLMVVIHSLVIAPDWVTLSPELALAIRSPRISTGPSAYLAVPSASQAMTAASGSPTRAAPPRRFAGSVQSRAASSSDSSSVSQARSLASAGAAASSVVSPSSAAGSSPVAGSSASAGPSPSAGASESSESGSSGSIASGSSREKASGSVT